MIMLDPLEAQYFNLMEDKISIKEFEHWVYESPWLESELSDDEYLNLISLNYSMSGVKYELGKILKARLDIGKIETVKMIGLLNSVIERDGREAENLMKLYDLYCKGYYFLEDLGIGIGLSIAAPNLYGVENFDDLDDGQKTELVNSFYPKAQELAIALKSLLLHGNLKLTGEQDAEFNRWQFIDYRKQEKKQS